MKHFYYKSVLTPLVLLSMILSGCQANVSLPEEYSLQVREELMLSSPGSSPKTPLFASELCVVTGSTQDGDSSLTADSGLLFNISDGTVLYSKNAYERIYPASTTKILTAIIALEEGTLSDRVTVTDAAVITEAGASLAGIKPGDVLTMEQLIYGLMIPSGNDAANAIAVHMSGSVEAFAERMNEKAREIGATDTHFTNPSGLNNEAHYSTAYDLYLMFNRALSIPKFREIINTEAYTANYMDASGTAVSKTWPTGNWYQKGETETPAGVTVLGGKTGTTQAAGYCLVMASEDSEGEEYISIVLKAENRTGLYNNMTQILSKIVN